MIFEYFFSLCLIASSFFPKCSGSIVTEEENSVEASPRHHSDRHMKVSLFPYDFFRIMSCMVLLLILVPDYIGIHVLHAIVS